MGIFRKAALDALSTPEQLNQDPALLTDPNAIREARWWFEDYGVPWPE